MDEHLHNDPLEEFFRRSLDDFGDEPSDDIWASLDERLRLHEEGLSAETAAEAAPSSTLESFLKSAFSINSLKWFSLAILGGLLSFLSYHIYQQQSEIADLSQHIENQSQTIEKLNDKVESLNPLSSPPMEKASKETTNELHLQTTQETEILDKNTPPVLAKDQGERTKVITPTPSNSHAAEAPKQSMLPSRIKKETTTLRNQKIASNQQIGGKTKIPVLENKAVIGGKKMANSQAIRRKTEIPVLDKEAVIGSEKTADNEAIGGKTKISVLEKKAVIGGEKTADNEAIGGKTKIPVLENKAVIGGEKIADNETIGGKMKAPVLENKAIIGGEKTAGSEAIGGKMKVPVLENKAVIGGEKMADNEAIGGKTKVPVLEKETVIGGEKIADSETIGGKMEVPVLEKETFIEGEKTADSETIGGEMKVPVLEKETVIGGEKTADNEIKSLDNPPIVEQKANKDKGVNRSSSKTKNKKNAKKQEKKAKFKKQKTKTFKKNSSQPEGALADETSKPKKETLSAESSTEETSETTVTPPKKPLPSNAGRWSIAVSFAPSHSFRRINNKRSDDVAKEINTREKAGFSYNAGLELGYRLNENWTLKSGLQYRQVKQIASHRFRLDCKKRSGGPFGAQIVDCQAERVRGSFGEVDLDFEFETDVPIVPGSKLEVDVENTRKIKWLRLPVLAQYTFGKGRLKASATAGIAANFLLNDRPDFRTLNPKDNRFRHRNTKHKKPESLPSPPQFSKNHLEYVVGLGLTYRASKQVHVFVEPTYSAAFKPVFENRDIETVPYSWNGNIGIRFAF